MWSPSTRRRSESSSLKGTATPECFHGLAHGSGFSSLMGMVGAKLAAADLGDMVWVKGVKLGDSALMTSKVLDT